MITTEKRPYELLVRWREGKITGAHVGFELTATEDGKVLSTTPLAVMAVDIGQGIGFPLADILAQVHTDALIGRDMAIAEKSAAQTERSAALAECRAAKDECTKREATISALTAELAEVTGVMEVMKAVEILAK